jgi:hypothetical protein
MARSTRSPSNTPPTASLNSQQYSCRNHRSPMALLSSLKKPSEIRGHSAAVAFTRSHSVPPCSHASQKKSPLPARRAHQPQLSTAHCQHRPYRQVRLVPHPRSLVHQQQRHRRKSPYRRFRPRQPHYPRAVRKYQRNLVVAVPFRLYPQPPRESRCFSYEFPALSRRRVHHNRQAASLLPGLAYSLRRRHRRFAPLPRAIQNPAPRLRVQNPRLQRIRLESQPLPNPIRNFVGQVGNLRPGCQPALFPASIQFQIRKPHPHPSRRPRKIAPKKYSHR